jgi:methylated-DNA-[protein]-cysteine S-methyltransferase/AraC family transcriptional regulator of adaptative response/methylated-DNA-[protein]-cysteine methyltransferase
MAELRFFLYTVPSKHGDWLAAFEGKDLVFLGSYNPGKKAVEKDLADYLHRHYHFHIGSFKTAKWTKGDFWKKKHPLKLQGTDFQKKVWAELLKVPSGTTLTYSDLAKKLKMPTAVRAVASAVAKNPVGVWVPCHRVVGKNRNVLKYHGGPEIKKGLLTSEGVVLEGFD